MWSIRTEFSSENMKRHMGYDWLRSEPAWLQGEDLQCGTNSQTKITHLSPNPSCKGGLVQNLGFDGGRFFLLPRSCQPSSSESCQCKSLGRSQRSMCLGPHDHADLFGQCWLFGHVTGMSTILGVSQSQQAGQHVRDRLWCMLFHCSACFSSCSLTANFLHQLLTALTHQQKVVFISLPSDNLLTMCCLALSLLFQQTC